MNTIDFGCDECAFFDSGRCRKNAPIVLAFEDAIVSVWPKVDPEDYCGEFQKFTPPDEQPK